MKTKILLLALFVTVGFYAQEKTCNTPKEDALEDLSSITKCSIKSGKSKDKKSRQISVRVSASKKRFLIKRNKKNAVASVGLSVSGINKSAKSLNAKNDAVTLLNTLSKAEVKSAKTFMTVDEVPTFKKCKATKGDKRIDCFNTEMVNHINEYFQYPGEAVRDQIQGEVWVRFIIDAEGRVTNLKTLGPDGAEILNEEAKRVVSKLPFFIPGELKGKKVPVKYGFPINFSLENE